MLAYTIPDNLRESIGNILFEVPALPHGFIVCLIRKATDLIRPERIWCNIMVHSNDGGGITAADAFPTFGKPLFVCQLTYDDASLSCLTGT